MTLKEASPENRFTCLLWILHFMRCGTVCLLSQASGIRTQSVSRWLRRWEKAGMVKMLGYSAIDPLSGLSGQWWIPTRKDPKALFNDQSLRAIVRPLSSNDANRTRCVRVGTNTWLRRHEMEASCAIARIAACLRTRNFPGKTESETYLRTVRKWNGCPRNAEEHANCHLITVPDIRIAGKAWAVNVEVESVIKSSKEYSSYVEKAEEGVYVIWIVRDRASAERLSAALRLAGRGRTRGHVLTTWENLEKALELSVKRAAGIVEPSRLAGDSSCAA